MPAQQIQKGTTYADFPAANSQVTAGNLNDHVDQAVLLPGAISAQSSSTPQVGDFVIAERTGSLFKYTLESIRTLFSAVFVQFTGGTMTGPLILNNSTPATSATAASKGYVDSTAASAAASAVALRVPSGTIVMWGGGVPPLGWLECNGQSTAGSAALIAIYGTNVPDLRGEFVRGWDHGKGVDQGRNVRSFQGQDIQPHTHTYVQTTQGTDTTSGGDTHYINASSGITGSTGGTETRPRNVALMFIVKT
jgi:microcystin-dependent protein